MSRHLPPAFLSRLRDLEASYLKEVDPMRQSGFSGGAADLAIGVYFLRFSAAGSGQQLGSRKVIVVR